jgi:hypothetical protein
MSRTEKQASADTNVDVENSAWSLAQDERKYNRPINANELNSNIGQEHLFAACANLTNNRPALMHLALEPSGTLYLGRNRFQLTHDKKYSGVPRTVPRGGYKSFG